MRMKKWTVLHVLKSNRFSGAEHVVTDIITSMPEINSYYISQKGPIEEVLKSKGIDYRMVDRLDRKSLLSIVREINPDIIHAHDFTASFYAVLCFSKKPVISHLHHNVPWMKKVGFRSAAYLFSSLFYKKILVVSKPVLEEFVFCRFIRRKTGVIGNPVNIEKIQKRTKEGKEERYWDMVFVGRLSEEKNIPLLLDIMETLSRRLKNCSIVIVGAGDGEVYLRSEIESRNLERFVTIKGFVENPYSIMKHSGILVLPSKWEGFGLAAVEALALGKPVVCSGVGGLDDIVNDSCGKKCGLDVAVYVDEIEKLLNDRDYYDMKCEGAACRAKELDNFESYMEQIKEVYDECKKVS